MILTQFSMYISSIKDEVLEFISKKQIPTSVYYEIDFKIYEIECFFESKESLSEQKKVNGKDPRFQLKFGDLLLKFRRDLMLNSFDPVFGDI